VIFQDFPGLGIFKKKIQDFPGGVGTLLNIVKGRRTVNILLRHVGPKVDKYLLCFLSPLSARRQLMLRLREGIVAGQFSFDPWVIGSPDRL